MPLNKISAHLVREGFYNKIKYFLVEILITILFGRLLDRSCIHIDLKTKAKWFKRGQIEKIKANFK